MDSSFNLSSGTDLSGELSHSYAYKVLSEAAYAEAVRTGIVPYDAYDLNPGAECIVAYDDWRLPEARRKKVYRNKDVVFVRVDLEDAVRQGFRVRYQIVSGKPSWRLHWTKGIRRLEDYASSSAAPKLRYNPNIQDAAEAIMRVTGVHRMNDEDTEKFIQLTANLRK